MFMINRGQNVEPPFFKPEERNAMLPGRRRAKTLRAKWKPSSDGEA
ncbi:hypothetical protein [Rhizobium lentis]|nr:hypothetical protein [Rhizobium lentis]